MRLRADKLNRKQDAEAYQQAQKSQTSNACCVVVACGSSENFVVEQVYKDSSHTHLSFVHASSGRFSHLFLHHVSR
jgi:hypothetical protein